MTLAIHHYHEVHGCLPPAYIADENGKPMHSWRVLLLPHMEQQALYDEYDFSEPWNGPNNRKLLDRVPHLFACPAGDRSKRPQCTNYVAVVGPDTAWPGESVTTFAEFEDGLENTVILIEDNRENIAWMEPRDIHIDDAVEFLSADRGTKAGFHNSEDFLYSYSTRRHIAFADSALLVAPQEKDRLFWSALFGVSDGIAGDREDWLTATIVRQPRIANWFQLALFFGLVFLPRRWILRKRTNESSR